MKRERLAALAGEWREKRNEHTGRRRGERDADEEDLLEWKYGVLELAAMAELEWMDTFADPFTASPEALSDFFRRPLALESPGARLFLRALRRRKEGGGEAVPGALRANLEALDVPGRVSKEGRARGERARQGLMRFYEALIRTADAATRALRTEDEIRAELERRQRIRIVNLSPDSATLARLVARRRGRKPRPSMKELAAELLLGVEGRKGDAAAELTRQRQAKKRDRKKKVTP